MAATFGLDFGTTNSVGTAIEPDPDTGRMSPRIFTDDGRPHPSVVWYPGDEPIVGRKAKEQLSELALGVFGDIVRSPKMYLGSPTDIYVGGVPRQAVDVVADVLRYLRKDMIDRDSGNNPFESAVITIPVTMRGPARAQLRNAAQKAGIRIHQFVHEPLAALYGYLRSKPNFRQELANLERRLVILFDWGGGTLDLTLCQLQDGVLTQVFNAGDNEVGGDIFDLRLRQLVFQKHEAQYPHTDWSQRQTSAESRLLQECESAKILLSTREQTTFLVPRLLAVPGPEKDLRMDVTRQEFEKSVQDLVSKGLSKIEDLLNMAGVNRGAIEYCLAIGGMVSMPAIQEGLGGVDI